jgi:TolB-like protein/DNA-binding winged helix-turn-helix (wHTH) protein
MRFLFGECTIDAEARELKRAGRVVHVEPQVFDVLVHLINRRDHVVSRDELVATVWHGRIVSDSTLSSRINAARQAIGDSGEQQALIRTIARRGFRFVGDLREVPSGRDGAQLGTDSPDAIMPVQTTDKGHPDGNSHHRVNGDNLPAPPSPALATPDKPSIAVLAFTNFSGDPEQEYFADGIVEDIIIALSRFRQLFVIARNSSFTYKGRAVDVKQVGRELGVRYVLQGSIRKAANQVRIAGQLVDTATGAHLWADRFDGMLENVFDLQDQVTASVVSAIAPKLEQAEIERAKRKVTGSLDAYDFYLRALSTIRQFSSEAIRESLHCCRRAIELDPEFAAAYGMAAWWYFRRYSNAALAPDSAKESAEAIAMARRAVEIGNDDAIALCMGGVTLAGIALEVDAGDAYIERALVLNPNLAIVWANSGLVKFWLGEHALAIDRLTHAMRLNPLDPLLYRVHGLLAYAHFFSGHDEQALAWAEKAFVAQPFFLPGAGIAAACYAKANRNEDARQAVANMIQFEPAIRISNFAVLRARFHCQEEVVRFSDELRKAGLPE